jgi:hypothetical protein
VNDMMCMYLCVWMYMPRYVCYILGYAMYVLGYVYAQVGMIHGHDTHIDMDRHMYTWMRLMDIGYLKIEIHEYALSLGI